MNNNPDKKRFRPSTTWELFFPKFYSTLMVPIQCTPCVLSNIRLGYKTILKCCNSCCTYLFITSHF